MRKQIYNLSALGIITLLISSCGQNKEDFSKQVLNSLKENPDQVLKIVEQAVENRKQQKVKKQEVAINKEIEKAITSPLKPLINKDTLIKGPTDAPITIVEYSDFECPFCSRSKQTLRALFEKYPGKIRLVFKHLPLSFHPNAMIAAKYYEAISLQSPQKAFEFHDRIFSNQSALKNGEMYLTNLAKELKIDMIRLNRDLHSQLVKNNIQEDIAEAQSFDFRGTPGFLINGVPVKGAYPLQHFEKIILQLQDKGKLVL